MLDESLKKPWLEFLFIKMHTIKTMVFMLDGNSEISAHVRSNLGYLVCHKSGFLSSGFTFFSSYVRNMF